LALARGPPGAGDPPAVAAPTGAAGDAADDVEDGAEACAAEPDPRVPEGAPTAGIVTEGDVTRGAATEGVETGALTGGVVTWGVVTGGVVTWGVVTDGVVPTGVVTDGTLTVGTVTDGTVTVGTVTDGTVTVGTVTDGTLTVGTVTDGTVTVGTLTRGTVTERPRDEDNGSDRPAAGMSPASGSRISASATPHRPGRRTRLPKPFPRPLDPVISPSPISRRQSRPIQLQLTANQSIATNLDRFPSLRQPERRDIGAATLGGGPVGDADAFCWGCGVAECRP
jgi:hypothetical protein